MGDSAIVLHSGSQNNKRGINSTLGSITFEVFKRSGAGLCPLRTIRDKGVMVSHIIIVVIIVFPDKGTEILMVVEVLSGVPVIGNEYNKGIFVLADFLKILQ